MTTKWVGHVEWITGVENASKLVSQGKRALEGLKNKLKIKLQETGWDLWVLYDMIWSLLTANGFKSGGSCP